MANRETEIDAWVDDRLETLTPPADSSPNTTRALAIFRERLQRRRNARPAWWWVCALPISVLGLLLILVPTSRACAQRPGACADRLLDSIFPAKIQQPRPVAQPQSAESVAAVHPDPQIVRKHAGASAPSVPPLVNYKQFGSPAAPVTFEIYLDYQCPPCAAFFQNVIPQLKAQYVETGKLRLVFRDFPIPVHRYSALAARYADAAGQIGFCDAAMHKIFETQSIWSADGDLDRQIALVVPPDLMAKVRELIHSDAISNSIAKDQEAGRIDDLHRTPSVIAIYDGKREVLEGTLSLERLKAYLDLR